MNTTGNDSLTETLTELKRAEHAFNKAYGKHNLEEALELLLSLELSDDLTERLYAHIVDTFAQNAFASYLRYDGIVGHLQIEAIRLQRQG